MIKRLEDILQPEITITTLLEIILQRETTIILKTIKILVRNLRIHVIRNLQEQNLQILENTPSQPELSLNRLELILSQQEPILSQQEVILNQVIVDQLEEVLEAVEEDLLVEEDAKNIF